MCNVCIVSSRQKITCGIPQGSSLGPILFLMFRIFADDTNVFSNARNIKTPETLINSGVN